MKLKTIKDQGNNMITAETDKGEVFWLKSRGDGAYFVIDDGFWKDKMFVEESIFKGKDNDGEDIHEMTEFLTDDKDQLKNY